MRAGLRLAVLLGALAFMPAGPVAALGPDEILADPVLEARARDLTRELRCLVCRNESIDDSNAELARDLRMVVRERLVEGYSNQEVLDFVVARYGEYVLLRPLPTGSNLVLWASGPVMLVLALGAAGLYLRRRRPEAAGPVAALSDEEKRRLAEILKD